MKNILIIVCGLLGSSILRKISKKKIAKKIFVYEKSEINIRKIKKLRLRATIIKSLKNGKHSSLWCKKIRPEYSGLSFSYPLNQ